LGGLKRLAGPRYNRASLARWIESDYKLNAAEVAIVLGTSIRYDVAELVDPHINVVAKIRKTVLAQLNKESK
jgi:amidase